MSRLSLRIRKPLKVEPGTKWWSRWNLSLPTQLRACEEYRRRQGYEILERFHEEGEGVKTTDRPSPQERQEMRPASRQREVLR